MTRKMKSQQNLAKLKKQMEEKKSEYAKVADRFNETKKRLDVNESKATRLRIVIRKSEMEFNNVIQLTALNTKFTINRSQSTFKKLTSGDLDAERGYTCKRTDL